MEKKSSSFIEDSSEEEGKLAQVVQLARGQSATQVPTARGGSAIRELATSQSAKMQSARMQLAIEEDPTQLLTQEEMEEWEQEWEETAKKRLNEHVDMLNNWVKHYASVTKRKFEVKQYRLLHMETKVHELMERLELIVYNAGN